MAIVGRQRSTRGASGLPSGRSRKTMPTSATSAAMPVGSPALIDDICTDSVGAMVRVRREHGPIVAFPKGGGEQTVFAFGPDANHAVFSDPHQYHIVGPPGPKRSSQRKFQQGLFGLNGNQHL